MFDYVVVGSGLAGSVIAERIAKIFKKKVLIIEKRAHIGGNVYDYWNENGLIVHKYGPHIFHTNLKEIWDYLSDFTEWLPYQHSVLGFIDGNLVPLPFNLNSLHKLFPNALAIRLEQKLLTSFAYNTKIPILKLKEIEDEDLKYLASYIYEKIFVNYTAKQWRSKIEDLDPAIFARVPVHISRDNRYFQDKYQGLPKSGYTNLIQNLLASSQIKILLNTDFREVLEVDLTTKEAKLFGQKYSGVIIYTGMLDELLSYKFGELPYRSLRFDFESINQANYQDVGTVNYPNDYDYTRITELKKLTGQISSKTTIVREYPQDYNRFSHDCDNIPYYPVSSPKNNELYNQYRQELRRMPNIVAVGRLADYSYYDMDKVISKALQVFNGLRG